MQMKIFFVVFYKTERVSLCKTPIKPHTEVKLHNPKVGRKASVICNGVRSTYFLKTENSGRQDEKNFLYAAQ